MRNHVTADVLTDLLAERHSKDVFVPQCKNGPTHTATDLLIMDAVAIARIRGVCGKLSRKK